MTQCLLRKLGDKLCEPSSPLFIGLHGYDGKSGRESLANIPEDYRGLLLSDYPVKGEDEERDLFLDAYSSTFDRQFSDVEEALRIEGKTDNEIRIKSLYLWSESPGTGKTTTASALLNEYLLRHYIGTLKRGEVPKQRPVYFLDVNELQTKYNEFNRPKVPDNIAEKAANIYYQSIEKAKHTEFVVLDDIGVRDSSTGFRGDLHSVINHRTTNRMTTIYTSNVPILELPEVFGEKRLADRVRDMCEEIHFSGGSRRGKRR